MIKKLSLIAAGLMLAQQAHSHQVISKFDIGQMASEANMVFRGKVVEVDYRASTAVKGQPSLPHTFVTFAIEDVIYGNPDAGNHQTITLRFMGGRTDKGDVMLVDQLPKFNIGDEDVLFVGKNGESECPLVECANGRFRVVDGMMYNEYGQQLVQDEKGEVKLGRSEDRSEFNTFAVGDKVFTRKKHKPSNKDSAEQGVGEPAAKQGAQAHFDAGSFVSQARKMIGDVNPKDTLGRTKVAYNVDKNTVFSIPAPKPTVAKTLARQAKAAAPKTAQESAEIDAMLRNGGDPVVK